MLFMFLIVQLCFLTILLFRLYASYQDLRGLPELLDKTLLVIKAPPDTLMECDSEEDVSYCTQIC